MSYPTGSSNVPASEHYDGTVGYNSLVHHLHKALDEIEDFARRWWSCLCGWRGLTLGYITPK
ncbi:hypothetical protein [Janthinobacterium sp. SUN137]|uniref:hypothetical protein n=1 Tax=Janthinobacterium sp. SUN137 TaxID=3014789 RepID=UPI002713FB4A|nr:hypothetical protein [Janthinobacterium sp. SUN137]MDO8040313.1 hypothetical protein [Janthinobacterium sp. SUN137]